MKKIFAITLLFAGITLVFFITFQSWSAKGLENSSLTKVPSALPDSVMKLCQKSCMNCHSNTGSGFAKSVVNFNKWETYTPAKQADKASRICNSITRGSMPPKGFRKNYPNMLPTEKEINMICAWAKTLQK